MINTILINVGFSIFAGIISSILVSYAIFLNDRKNACLKILKEYKYHANNIVYMFKNIAIQFSNHFQVEIFYEKKINLPTINHSQLNMFKKIVKSDIKHIEKTILELESFIPLLHNTRYFFFGFEINRKYSNKTINKICEIHKCITEEVKLVILMLKGCILTDKDDINININIINNIICYHYNRVINDINNHAQLLKNS